MPIRSSWRTPSARRAARRHVCPPAALYACQSSSLGRGFPAREELIVRLSRIYTITALYPQRYSSVHAQVHHHFNQERHVVTRSVYQQRRSAALEEWRALAA